VDKGRSIFGGNTFHGEAMTMHSRCCSGSITTE